MVRSGYLWQTTDDARLILTTTLERLRFPMQKRFKVSFDITLKEGEESFNTYDALRKQGNTLNGSILIPDYADIEEITPLIVIPNESVAYACYSGRREYVAFLKRDNIWYDISVGFREATEKTDVHMLTIKHYEVVDPQGKLISK